MRLWLKILTMGILLSIWGHPKAEPAEPIKIGSKKFTESVIIGEITTQLARTAHPQATHLRELGGTRVLWNALLRGDIDLYPEYTGTIMEEIFADKAIPNLKALTAELSNHQIEMSGSLGFQNNYALGIKKEVAGKMNIQTISDLQEYPRLRFGFSNEFMDRSDGWPGLQQAYDLPARNVRGLDHDLAYRAIESGAIHVTDLYTTDAEIRYYNLTTLKDDRHYFTEYEAILLYRSDLRTGAPQALKAMLQLEGQISGSRMIEMNSRVKLEGIPESRVAANFLAETFNINTRTQPLTFWERLRKNTRQHLFLVFISLCAAILLSIPLGILAYRIKKAGQIVLGIVGIIQTIPSLALIVFMIPLLGIGAGPAILALFLYSLLPIVRNTFSGLHDIPGPIRESAIALGLSPLARLRLIELPLASRSILAGIKTSAVINVGTATLGALIGAGGYGQPILTGIRLDDVGLILQGAVPAALLALMTQGFFELLELVLAPKGLRIKGEV